MKPTTDIVDNAQRLKSGSLQFLAQKADDLVGLDESDHAAQGIDNGECVQIVFIE
jgi:hypothetical protein